MILNDQTFVLFAAKAYDNPNCAGTDEFLEDLSRFKYIKRLFTKYIEGGEMRERLVLNHLIVLYNLFGDATTPMLFYRLEGQWQYLKPFLVALDRMPEVLHDIAGNHLVYSSSIPMDQHIVDLLRKDLNGKPSS